MWPGSSEGHRVILATIVETWGSSPRPAGAMLAVRDDGLVAGSVSGGCVEDDLIVRIRNRSLAVEKPEIATYGISKDEATRYGLPCGGKLELVLEPVSDSAGARPNCWTAWIATNWWRERWIMRYRRGDACGRRAGPTIR